jgi:hypothetical protein
MTYKNKAEAQRVIAEHEAKAKWCGHAKTTLRVGAPLRTQRLREAKKHRAEVARIRALLPTLPE